MRPCSLLLVWLLMVPVCAGAGDIELPSDVSISLSAEPSSNLRPGQRVTFTLSATNHGPEPLDRLSFRSSPLYDQLDIGSGLIADCDGELVLAVVDTEDSFHYLLFWYATLSDLEPILVDETRSCQFGFDYTQWAPPVFPLTFEFGIFNDPNPANNSAPVSLRGAVPATPVPALSAGWRMLLLALTAGVAAAVLRIRARGRGTHDQVELARRPVE